MERFDSQDNQVNYSWDYFPKPKRLSGFRWLTVHISTEFIIHDCYNFIMVSKLKQVIPGYISSSRCTVCQAGDLEGKPLRDDADAKIVAGFDLQQVVGWLKSKGVLTDKQKLAHHLKEHSSYVLKSKQELSRKQQVLRQNIEFQKQDANKALERIISIGDAMVNNFYKQEFTGEQVTGPVLAVDQRLYVEALREQGRRGILTKLDEAFESMEKKMYKKQAVEGELIDETKLPEKVNE